MKLSVVIPVYNVEDTLDRCVESILKQGVPDIEIILVDDGSPDSCPAICDRLSSEYPAVKTVHKANGGLSSARNAGIAVAGGDYITFADSDDYVQEGSYKALAGILESHGEYDILEYPVMEFAGSPKEHLLTFSDTVYKNASEYWLQGRAYAHSYAWNKIYRRALFDDVRFPEGMVFEDAWTLPKIIRRAGCIATCSKGLYFYCFNGSGITNTAGGREFKMLLDAHIEAMKSLELEKGADFLRYYIHAANIQIQTYEHDGRKVSLPEIKIGKEIKSYLSFRDVPASFKIKCIIIKIFNLNILCRLINLLTKRHRSR